MYKIIFTRNNCELVSNIKTFEKASDEIKYFTQPDMLYKKDEVKITYEYDRKEAKMWNLVLDLLIKGDNVAAIIEQLKDVVKRLEAGQLSYSNYVEGDTKLEFEVEYEIRKAK